MPTKERIIEILKNEINNYTELGPDGLDVTNVDTQVLRFAILYLKEEDNKILNMIEKLPVVDDNLLQKLWNAFYKEEDEWEQLFRGTSNHDKWFMTYRPWLQAGFEIAIKALSQEIEKQNGTN